MNGVTPYSATWSFSHDCCEEAGGAFTMQGEPALRSTEKPEDISACVFVLIRLKERELPDDATYGTIRDNELVGAADCEAVRLSTLDEESLRHIRLDHNRYILPAGRTLTRVDGYYAYSCQRHPIRYVHYVDRDAILNDLFRKLADG